MLKICKKLSELDFDQLCRVYDYKENSFAQRRKLYDYLTDDFFRREGSFYAVWILNDEYVSSLRMEPFDDGLLLEAFQTRVGERRKGYGKSLLNAILNSNFIPDKMPVYAHIYKNNLVSLRLHRTCGFQPCLDYARFVDGIVSANACTVKWIK